VLGEVEMSNQVAEKLAARVEALAYRVAQLELELRDQLEYWRSEWASVGNHPSSKCAHEVKRLEELLNKGAK
jgi:hypothetical protein